MPVDEISTHVPSRVPFEAAIRTPSFPEAGARQRLERGLGAADDNGLIAELGDKIAKDLGQPLVVLHDQDPHGAHSAATPQKTGSGVRRTPKRSATAVCTRRANATTSRARAPSWATIARA